MRQIIDSDDTGSNEHSDDESDEAGVFTIRVNNMKSDRSKQPLFNITIAGTPLTMMADSGSSINILDEQDYKKLSPLPSLEKTRVKIFPYQTQIPLPVLGRFNALTSSETTHRTATFYVVKGTSASLLSWRTSTDMNLLAVVRHIKQEEAPTVDQLLHDNEELFQGLDNLKVSEI